MKLTGAQAIVKTLEMEGVEVIFGIPGGATLNIYDVLRDSKIKHYLMRHEQVAAHAADGYARASGKVGVCMATSGPGATNLVTGIANAYMDSIPIVAITGQVATSVIGTDAFQEADTTGITLPIVKHSYLITNPEEIPSVIREAFHIASTGRPGPVVIDVPKDMTIAKIKYEFPEKVSLPGYQPTYRGHVKQIRQAVRAILEAEKPVLFAGGGVIASGASSELKEFAELLNLPVTYTLMGKGAFPETHPLSLGMLGMHGTCYANFAMVETDLIIAVGVRFDDRATGRLDRFAPKAKIIHIDIDPAEIGKNVPVYIPIVGDAKTVLNQLLEELKKKDRSTFPTYSKWHEIIQGWRREYPLTYPDDDELRPQFVVDMIYQLTKDRETIITTGVGQNQMWAAQFYHQEKPRRFLSSGGLGTMGYGFPAAIGAQVAQPDALVVDIDGDGSFQMVLQDLATVSVYNLPVKVVIMNNGYLGMVRQWQQLFYGRRYFAVDLAPGVPDFKKLAEAYGVKGITVKKKDELVPALEKAFSEPVPYVIDVWISREENVFPMVPAGAGLDELLKGEER
jgi:acetolactate synthase-1/2/3 large subunit